MADALGHQNIGLEYANAASQTATSITITLNSLGISAQRSSVAVSNVSGFYTNLSAIDAHVMVKIKTGGSVTGTPLVNVYVAGSNDNGTTWTDGTTGLGTDANVSLTSPLIVQQLGQINTPSAGTVYVGGPWSIASRFGQVPSAWCIIVENKTGGSLDATAGGSATYQPIALVSF